jgi:hypothetical protein
LQSQTPVWFTELTKHQQHKYNIKRIKFSFKQTQRNFGGTKQISQWLKSSVMAGRADKQSEGIQPT